MKLSGMQKVGVTFLGMFVLHLSVSIWWFINAFACGESNTCGSAIHTMEAVLMFPVFYLRIGLDGGGGLVFLSVINSAVVAIFFSVVTGVVLFIRRANALGSA